MKQIITISREFGSGGHAIGEEVAKRLGIPFYDSQILERIAEKTGFSKEFIEKQGEYSPSGSLFSYGFVGRDAAGSSLSDKIYAVQEKCILELAQKESFVIIGRCADHILRECEEARHVFIYGNPEEKQKRIEKIYEKTPKQAQRMMQQMDKKRRLHYNYYTEQEWGNRKNYTMTLNSSVLGYEKCIQLIMAMVNSEK